jgi:hypothetical protein
MTQMSVQTLHRCLKPSATAAAAINAQGLLPPDALQLTSVCAALIPSEAPGEQSKSVAIDLGSQQQQNLRQGGWTTLQLTSETCAEQAGRKGRTRLVSKARQPLPCY